MERYRIVEGQSLYYVTFSVVQWLPVFISEAACRVITESLTFCHAHKALRINGFIIMPTHLHAILFDEGFDAGRLARTLTDFRKFTGRRLADYCVGNLPLCFSQVLNATLAEDRGRQFWQVSRHPEAIGTEAFHRQKANYLHANPCRKGLVRQPEHWRFSSAAYWLSEGREDPDVPLTGIDW